MRTWLAICAVALTACAAEPDAEAQIEVPQVVEGTASTDEAVTFDVRKRVPQLQGKSDACVQAFLQNRAVRLRRAFGHEEGEVDKRPIETVLDGIEPCRTKLEEARQQESVPQLKLKKTKKQDFETVTEWITQGTLYCHGIAKQGGLVVCHTAPNARVEVGRSEKDTYTQTADKDGVLIVGFDRDEPAAFVRVGDARVDFDIKPREYDTSRIDGLPKKFVSEYTADQLKQIRAASAHKKIGFASKVEDVGFKDGFIYPVTTHTKTTNFGAQRILNGDPKRPHFGVDLAAPKGTPILAPADGIVSLASEEMYFEGSLIMIDHGQGLISYYLHNEDVMVEEGQRVVQGEQIGTVGSRGRSTGPHLCWRLKWRGRNLDPELLTEWPQRG